MFIRHSINFDYNIKSYEYVNIELNKPNDFSIGDLYSFIVH